MHNMVIVSSILERDDSHMENLANTAGWLIHVFFGSQFHIQRTVIGLCDYMIAIINLLSSSFVLRPPLSMKLQHNVTEEHSFNNI